MGLEKKLVASALLSRRAYNAIYEDGAILPSLPQSEWIVERAREFYDTDKEASRVDVDWLKEYARTSFDSDKKFNEYVSFIDEVIGHEVSVSNVTALVIEQKRKDIANRLAVALVNDSNEVESLMSQYQGMEGDTSEDDEDVYHNVSISDSLDTVLDQSNLIKLPTRALNEVLEGGVVPGTHVVLGARPETGKTAMCISIMRAMAFQGLSGIYFGNEDPILQIAARAQMAFSGMTKEEIKAQPDVAQARLDDSNFEHVRLISINPGTPAMIRRYCRTYKPKWVIVDQIRNLYMGNDNRVNQLEAAATEMRNIAKEFGVVMFSVTQAGDSAENKLVLGMGDIDYSNTGIPAQADLMVMIGVNQEFADQGMRMISLPKNKVSGKHLHFPIRLNGPLSRYEDV